MKNLMEEIKAASKFGYIQGQKAARAEGAQKKSHTQKQYTDAGSAGQKGGK